MRLDFKGKKATVVGLGLEGIDLVRYLTGQGAIVTVSDSRPEEALKKQLAQIRGLTVDLRLGGNGREDFEGADAIFLSQSVPLDLPALDEARKRGVPVLSQMGLFFNLCPGPVVGITGSSGKTTTTALVGAIFAAAGRQHLVGGNIGRPLLSELDSLTPEAWAILEISHTQLQTLGKSPHIACVTNVTPNHLDRFTWDEYLDLKANIMRHQSGGDYVVLGYDDPEARGFSEKAKGRLVFFTTGPDLPDGGVLVEGGWAIWRWEGRDQPVLPLSLIKLRGEHNVQNVLAATAVACLAGIEARAIADAVASFLGVPHRLELVAALEGVSYYNDSIATTPERTIAGLHSFTEPVVLLLGGRDKHLPLDRLAQETCRKCRGVIFFGEAGGLLSEAIDNYARRWPLAQRPLTARVATLADAVHAAWEMARPGDVVLLSPACTSFDAYNNFEERGEEFRALISGLEEEVRPSPR